MINLYFLNYKYICNTVWTCYCETQVNSGVKRCRAAFEGLMGKLMKYSSRTLKVTSDDDEKDKVL